VKANAALAGKRSIRFHAVLKLLVAT